MKKAIFLIALALIGMGAAAVHGQITTSAVSGTVTDDTGAVIPGADISVVNTSTEVAYHGVTDNLGAFHITQLPPGSYTMTVTKSGFQTENLRSFKLFVDQHLQQSIVLGVGQLTQSVSVSAATQLIDSQSTDEGQVIENQQIDNMPLNGRDVLQLAQLSAGVTPIVAGMNSQASQWAGGASATSPGYFPITVSIGGLGDDWNSFLFDGIETRNAWYGGDALFPSPDAIQEFRVNQSGAPAEYGDGGAFINIVSRSGTDHFHGTVYEYVRNNDLDARNYFDIGPPPPFHQNQFGASLGGPIKRKKIFFFANYEGFRQIQPKDEYNLVPTAQQRAGNFSADSIQLVNPLNKYAPFTGNQISSQYFSPVGQAILALYPAPNGTFTDGTTNYFDVADNIDNWDQETARVDYTISSKDTAFVRYTTENQTQTVTDITPQREILYPANPKNLAVGWTRVFSPNLVNNFRYGWSHTEYGEERADGYNSSDANPLNLINEVDVPGSYGYPSFGVTNYANPGSTEGTDISREGMNIWTDSIMLQKGRDQIVAGLDLRYQPIYLYEDYAASSLTFNGTYSGDPIADVLLGVPSTGSTAIGDPELNLRMWYQGYYVQNNWQVTPRLNVNLGGRWDHFQPPVDTRNHVGSYDIATNQDLSYPATSVLGLGRNMVKPTYLNFAPRVGFNWLPFARGNTDVKGGFGIYYVQSNINQYDNEVDTTEYYKVQTFPNSKQGTSLNYTLSNLWGSNVPASNPSISFIQPNGPTTYIYEWNLTIDQALKNWLFEVAYLGNAAHHYEERPSLNQETPQATFPLAGWVEVQENTMTGSSFYSALVTRIQRRYSSGFQLMGSYTFSKCLGMPWGIQSGRPLDLEADRGHCVEDMNQNLVANGIYELPFGHGKKFLNKSTLADAVVGGWKVAAIADLHSGPWLTLTSRQSLGSFILAYPNFLGPVNNPALHSGLGKHGRLGPYFNVQNVQAVTATGVQGNGCFKCTATPGSAEWDLAGDKTWKIADRYQLTFRADVFNAFNRANFYGMGLGAGTTTLGYLSAADEAREIQLSLRANF